MATIDIRTVGNLLTVSVTGDLDVKEVIAVVEEYYPNGIVKDVIWNLTNGSITTISTQGFKEIANVTLKTVANRARQGGRTVFVGNSSAEFGLMRMYAVIAEIAGVSIKYTVFKSMEEALKWLE
jgi:dihydrodipicolinate synthase/N-acetylneuraminate lyase